MEKKVLVDMGGIFARLSAGALFFWCVLIEAVGALAYCLFRMEIDGDWFLLFTGTSLDDRLQFIRLYAFEVATVLFVLLLSFVGMIWATFFASRKVFLLALSVVVCAAIVRVSFVGALKAWKPVYVAYDTFRSARDYVSVGEAGRWTKERAANVHTARAGATNYVFVVGESLTSQRVPFLGYGKNTMPHLAALADKLAVFGPVRVHSPYTIRSLMSLFISDGTTAAVSFRQAGFATGYISAHNRWGRYCSIEAAIFDACEKKIYLSDINNGAEIYDEQLLPHISALTKREPFALFVHMMGSHFEPGKRVPKDFAADAGLDDYDRSVRYTDMVLARLIKSLPPRTEMIFISDHGESVDLGNWRDFSADSLWNVPVFVYPASSGVKINSVEDFVAAWQSRAKHCAGR